MLKSITCSLILISVQFAGGFKPATRELHTYEDHPCIRPCRANDFRTCRYEFHLEYYYTLSKACYSCPRNITDCFRPHCVTADGNPRAILVVNRMLPGPAIHVCQNDTVEVKVHNELVGGEGTSIHWHGIHQHGTPHMDGVGLVTQCPINEASTFTYRFRADPPGTHFWHAHSGLQRADGLFGGLVVRQAPELEPHTGLYDEDLPGHTLIVNDWLHEVTVFRFAMHHHTGGDNKPPAILINGKGLQAPYLNWTGTQPPVSVFNVSRGQRYRFRVISNGVLNCPIQISIDNHTLTMIATDGNAVNETEVSFFNIFAGERYDFGLSASARVDNYWIRAKGLADCEVKHAKQLAVLRYEGAPEDVKIDGSEWNEPLPFGKVLNPLNHPGSEDLITVAALMSLDNNSNPALRHTPDKKFYLAMDFYKIDNYHYQDEMLYSLSSVNESTHLYMPQINHISLKLPPAPPLTQSHDLDKAMFCNNDTVGDTDCTRRFCECVHVLHVGLGDVIELVVFDEGVMYNASHPMHLHGHKFYVVGLGKLGDTITFDEVKRLENDGKLHRNLHNPVSKDTVTVPDGGYVILRLHANNPGFWFFHCHLEFHVGIGMGVVIQTGQPHDMPSPPPGFPTCGNWCPAQNDMHVT